MTRLGVYGFLALLLVTAVQRYELWPFTSWELFSQVRTDTTYGWSVTTVDDEGIEAPLVFAELPRGFHGAFHVASQLPKRTPAEVEAICRDWGLAAEAATGTDVVEVRVYRTTAKVVRPDRPRPPIERVRRFGCEL